MRIENGELKNPEKTQLEKLKRKPDIKKEIEELTDQLENM